MKRHFLAIALMACASLAVACYERTAGPVISAFMVGYAKLKDWALDGLALASAAADKLAPPAVVLVQAKAFVLRLTKRDRPVITASWRMCPSA